jgi:uncharacterized protein (DUF342 family)
MNAELSKLQKDFAAHLRKCEEYIEELKEDLTDFNDYAIQKQQYQVGIYDRNNAENNVLKFQNEKDIEEFTTINIVLLEKRLRLAEKEYANLTFESWLKQQEAKGAAK